MMVRELGFEMKAQPSEKMKTPEELAREAQEKLQKLEVHSLLSFGSNFSYYIFYYYIFCLSISKSCFRFGF